MTGKRPHTLIPLALSLLTMVGCAQPWASGGLSGVAETGYQAPVHSWKYHKEHNVVMQGLDFSCGSAALATVMKYRFDDDVSEGDLLADILKSLSEQESTTAYRTASLFWTLRNALSVGAIRRSG
jgi:hypothetical protein